MKNMNEASIRNVVGIIGNITSFGLFMAPVPTFRRIWNQGTTEDFHPYPYLACMMNCLFWIFYGLPIVHPDSTLVIIINGIGLFFQIVYLSMFFWYTTQNNRRMVILGVFVEVLVLALIVFITLTSFQAHESRSMFVGIICVIFGIIMYASPLTILRQVIQTKSVEFLPVWLCFAGLLNGVCWLIYANLKTFDLYLTIANGAGAFLGSIQLCVYFHYRWCCGKNQANVNEGDVELVAFQ